MNVDGDYKGNPILVGSGGIFYDYNSCPLREFAVNCGVASNNMEKFMALEKGIEIDIRERFKLLNDDGNSQIVIYCVKKKMANQLRR